MEPTQDYQSRPADSKAPCRTVSGIFQKPVDGAVLALWTGLMLLLASFAIKQVMVSWMLTNVSDALEYPRLQTKLEAEMGDLNENTTSKAREAIRAKYEADIEKAQKQMVWAGERAIHKAQWTVWLKCLLDLVKIASYALILFGSLRIVTDPVASGTLKVYATVLGGITFLTCVLGGLIAYLS